MLETWDIILDSTLDAAKDTLFVIPFLLVTYLIMEWIEHNLSEKTKNKIARAGKAGPLFGSLLGLIPQCGFSSAASAFYAGRVITLGTLFSVYLATSDEMIPIFIAGGIDPVKMVIMLVVKFAIGIVFGFFVDFILRRKGEQNLGLKIHELCKREHCDCSGNCQACKENPASVYESKDCIDGNCQHDHNHHNHQGASIFKSALIHTIQITLFVFVITLVLNLLIAFCGGENTVKAFLENNKIAAVLGSSLIGLIPNCAPSVLIAELYCNNVIGFGVCLSGLLSAAGLGLLVLIKTNRPMKDNVYIIIILYVISVMCGIIAELIFV